MGIALIDENEGLGVGDGIDVLGSVLVTAAMMVGIYAIVKASSDGWGSTPTLGFGAAAVVLLVAFVLLESRLKTPSSPCGSSRSAA